MPKLTLTRAINFKKGTRPIVADCPAYGAILIGPLRFSTEALPISVLLIIFKLVTDLEYVALTMILGIDSDWLMSLNPRFFLLLTYGVDAPKYKQLNLLA